MIKSTVQSAAIETYCDRHGHTWAAGTGPQRCLNCPATRHESDHGTARPPIPRNDTSEEDEGWHTTGSAVLGQMGERHAADTKRADHFYEPVDEATRDAVLRAIKGADTSGIDPADGQTIAKATNPKDAIGATKLPVSWVPTAVNRYAALGFAEGALKYGRYNWRIAGVRISIYLDAIHRHLMKLQDGEWCDGDSLGPDEDGNPQGTQVPHLGSIICCAGIILDSWECDKLTDDRPPSHTMTSSDMESRIDHIAYLKKMFAAFNPHQNTIADSPREEN